MVEISTSRSTRGPVPPGGVVRRGGLVALVAGSLLLAGCAFGPPTAAVPGPTARAADPGTALLAATAVADSGGSAPGVFDDLGSAGVRAAGAPADDPGSAAPALSWAPVPAVAAAPAPATSPEISGPLALPGPPAPPPTGAPVDCAVEPCVALTFDDGPGPYTAELLDELRAADVRATFFVTGLNAAQRPDLVRLAAADGHTIGNHTWSHPRLPALGTAGIAAEIDRTTEALAAAGVTTGLLRPPYGETGPAVAAVAAERGMAQVLWDVDTEDWRNRDVGVTTQRVLDGAHPGAIVLMHDIHPTTVAAVPGIVDALRAEGYALVTVPELLGSTTPGETYR